MCKEKELSENALKDVTGGEKLPLPDCLDPDKRKQDFDNNNNLDPLQDGAAPFNPMSGEGIRGKQSEVPNDDLNNVTGGFFSSSPDYMGFGEPESGNKQTETGNSGSTGTGK